TRDAIFICKLCRCDIYFASGRRPTSARVASLETIPRSTKAEPDTDMRRVLMPALPSACRRPSLLKLWATGLAVIWLAGAPLSPASAQDAGVVDPNQKRDWAPGAINHAQQMRAHEDVDSGVQPTPRIIPKFEIDLDPSGSVGTFQPAAATITADNAFFQNLGSNGRTCFTCHQPQTGWTVSADSVRARFHASAGKDPIFRLVDGATCPTDDVSTPAATRRDRRLRPDRGPVTSRLPTPPRVP